ncbi:MAG: ribonuclease Z [Nitrospirae bacterium]|nr:ribonuclease Z [Nitrospirota bacterium]MBI3352702.1 ribonuclease Z [Nitrospirota bacterium]
MAPLLYPRLVNGPFGDPGLYIDIKWEHRAILFDLGNNAQLSPSSVLKVSDVFISHTHMDHFIGFDRFLRIILSHPRTIRFYGPPGLIKNIQGKLSGYTWNLTGEYQLNLEVTELHTHCRVLTSLKASNGFEPDPLQTLPFTEELLKEPMFSVFTKALDHKIPSLAFSLNERFHINVNKDVLEKMGLAPGEWLRKLKDAIWQNQSGETLFEIPVRENNVEVKKIFHLKDLSGLYTITKGQKISYVVDTLYSKENEEKIVDLAKGSTTFFCESPFLQQDVHQAENRYHLTAWQAGTLARKAQVDTFNVFHFSPRYAGAEKELYEEAYTAFKAKS